MNNHTLHALPDSPRMQRRTLLTRLTNTAIVGSTLIWLTGCDSLSLLYSGMANQFGGIITVGKKEEFPAASPTNCTLDQAGVFHIPIARTYLVHLTKTTSFLLAGAALKNRLAFEDVLMDTDGSYWIALYQRCTHLGCTFAFRSNCASFKCPCHGSHFNITGEYLGGPAIRSLDRFPLSFHGEEVQVDTGRLKNNFAKPESTTRLVPVPNILCTP